MALSLLESPESDKKIHFPNIEFNQAKSIFKLSTANKGKTISIEYVPIIDEEFGAKEFDLVFLSNTYLNAENDVFQVIENELEKRIGWIFPIQLLESNENDYSTNVHLNKYKFATFKEILKRPATKEIAHDQSTYQLSDLFDENIILFIVSRETFPQGMKFDLSNYLPSLANVGYYCWDDKEHHFYPEQQELVLRKRGKQKIKIVKSKTSILNDEFLFHLYFIHLKSINHFLLKFHFLYQVIEYLIEENFEFEFDEILKEYNQKNLSKNDLKEKINHISRERAGIKQLITSISIRKKVKVDFIRDCTLLLENYHTNPASGIGDLLYDTRNLVVHRYREITKNNENLNLLKLITHELELVINDIVINYYPQQRLL